MRFVRDVNGEHFDIGIRRRHEGRVPKSWRKREPAVFKLWNSTIPRDDAKDNNDKPPAKPEYEREGDLSSNVVGGTQSASSPQTLVPDINHEIQNF